jgi:hypothetical protein
LGLALHDSPIAGAADLPMSLLSTYYLIKSLDECIGSADANRSPPYEMVVCDLTVGTTTIIYILCIIKSNGMLLYKACRLHYSVPLPCPRQSARPAHVPKRCRFR